MTCNRGQSTEWETSERQDTKPEMALHMDLGRAMKVIGKR